MSKNRRGINFQIGGSFLRYILWAAIFLTMQGIGTWFASLGLGLNGFNNGFGTGELGPIAAVVNTVRSRRSAGPPGSGDRSGVGRQAIFDIGEGHNPLPSIISALFMLGIQGLFTIFQGWNDRLRLRNHRFPGKRLELRGLTALSAGCIARDWRGGVGLRTRP